MSSKLSVVCVLTLASLTQAASAGTVAYYRFEEGPENGFLVGQMGDPTVGTFTTTLDTAGGDDNLRTFNAPATQQNNFDTSPRYTTGVPSATVPQTGTPNNYSFTFGQVDGLNDDIYAAAPGPLNTSFDNGSTFTVETYINTNAPDAFRTFIGRDDFANEVPGLSSLFYLQTRAIGGGIVAFAAQDKQNVTREINGPVLAANTWYHVAVVGDGTNATLYLDGTSVGSVGFNGLYNSSSSQGFTVGRGFFNGNPADFWNGEIDEVRFSNEALSPSQFLNAAAVPEPTTIGLLGVTASLLMARRRRR